jgi:hypothetical protein
MSKQGNRWSLSTYTIHTVQKFNNAPPQYKLTLHSGKKPSDFKTDADGVSTVWYSHDQLQLNWADVDAPQALMDNTAPSGSGTFAVGDRIAVEWVRETPNPEPRRHDTSVLAVSCYNKGNIYSSSYPRPVTNVNHLSQAVHHGRKF